MLVVSNDFKTAMTQPVKQLQGYIDSNGTRITDADDLINFKISCSTSMCKTAMRKLEAKYLGEHNLLGSWVHVGYAVKLANGTYEYLDYGSFLVSEITYTKDTGVTTITGYDKMVSAMTEYSVLDVKYPISLYNYTVALCNACGLELGNESLPTMSSFVIKKELWENISGITYRDILVQIAQATASTCIISNDDKVYFKKNTPTGESLTYDNLMKLKLEEKYGEINSVVLSRTPAEDNIYRRDEASIEANGLTEFKIENNEIIDKERDIAMTFLYPALHGIAYYPFEAQTEGLGWYEIGDSITIVNDLGDEFDTTIFNISITLDGALRETLKTQADTKTQTQYQYASTIAKRVKNTEIIVDKQEQLIEELVTDMYEVDGVVNQNFTKVHQDIENVITNVQNSGGNNLIKNSVMFAYDDNGKPSEWDISLSGRNIFNRAELIIGSINGDGTMGGTTFRARTSKPIPVVRGTTYTLSIKTGVYKGVRLGVHEYTSNGTQVIDNGWRNITTNAGNQAYVFTTKPTTDYLLIVFSFSSTDYTVTTGGTEISGTVDINSLNNNFEMQIERGGVATDYTPYHTDGLIIDSNTESMTVGAISGHSFELLDKYVYQTVRVKKDEENILPANKTYYTFNTRIKKASTGICYIRIYNSVEWYEIAINVGESAYYKEFEITLLPKDTYYTFEFYGSADSEATFTDNMLALGSYKSQWTQANGEIMNTQVNINIDGVLVKSSVYLGDYTVMSPLEFAGYSKINGQTVRVFSLNKDTTVVTKLKAEDEVRMYPIKIVPITSGNLQGWAFVPSTED